jgi:biotin carboxyl carrier protein
MRLVARVGERVEEVLVERDGSRYRVRLGERDYDVEARSLGPFVKSLLVDGESHEAAVFRKSERRWAVGWRGRTTEVEIVAPLEHLAERARAGDARAGKRTVAAYMPGRVVAVAVVEGETVAAGQALVVLEAMKMQNEIRADRPGVVRRVHVVSGQAVENGDALVEIE